MSKILRSQFFLLAAVASSPLSFAQDDRERERFFEAKIRPVLVSQCYECHSASSKEPKGMLLLDTREGTLTGGESGHAVVPGNLDESLILSALKYESFEMPPEQQLPENVIADFEEWIRLGAYDPRDGKSAPIRREIDFELARAFWSFQPIGHPPAPAAGDAPWLRSDIDAFIAAALESQGIAPVDDADGATLVRRIYFDLIGMQPSPEDAATFVDAYAADPDAAIAATVDELLRSRHFGERWGRHWLDVVRYAESTGMERNGSYPHAWRYRDWVIDAFNDDKPFDRFAMEQIAGDLLPYDDFSRHTSNMIATGMLAIGPKSLNEPNAEKFTMDVVDEQIDVVSRAFLGLTASCARCHDHKFDPIPQSEYYSLAGVFTSTETLYGTGKTNGNRRPGGLLAVAGEKVQKVSAVNGPDNQKLKKQYETQLKNEQKKLANLQRQLAAAKKSAKAALEKRIAESEDEIRRKTNQIKQVSTPVDKAEAGAELIMAVLDAKQIEDTHLRIRGEPDEHGSRVPRGFLTIASLGETPDIPENCSGRLELAQWITAPNNPLTARVAVNRVWQHLFGRGLVTTVNNFGANGDRPTHPELLDHLASRFMEDHWSVKGLIRRIMLSRVYRLASLDDAAALEIDPDNHLLWRMNQRRLEAEALRDAMLVASGQIDLEPAEKSIVAKLGDGLVGRNLKPSQILAASRSRSVYLPIVRGVLPEILRIFDFPEPSIIGGMRDVTTVPTQALFMMNNEFVFDAADGLAQRLLAEAEQSASQRIELAYRLTLTRAPSTQEIDTAVAFIDEMQAMLEKREKQTAQESEQLAWASFCQSLFATSEFRYVN